MRWSISSPLLALLGFLSFLSTTLAIQANLAGIVDWHKPLIGLPLLDPSPPSLIETTGERRIVAITKSNVLGVLNAENGDVVWRYKLEDSDPVVSYHVHDDSVLLLSGPSGTTVRLFSLATGGVKWERPLHTAANARLTTPVHLGTDVDFTEDGGSVVVLSDGRRITKLSMATGKVEWSLDAPGAGDTVLFKQILISSETIHTLALTSSFESTTLTTLSFDLKTSRPLGDFTQIPSWIPNPSQAALAQGNGQGAAKVVWYEHGRVRSAYISAAGALGGTKDMLPGKALLFKEIVNTQARRRGLILGANSAGGVVVVDVNQGKVIDEFENSRDSEDKSPSVYSAAIGKNSVTFNRVYWSFSMGLAVAETNTINSDGEAITTGFTFPFDTASYGVILAGAVNSNIGPKQLPHVVLTTSNGAIQFISQEKLFWTREEALTDLAAVKFIEPGEREVEEVKHALAEEGFVARTLRHAIELKDLPAYLFRFVRRFTSSSYASTLYTPALNATNLHRDQFGLQKLLVTVSKSGRVFAMDSSNGQNVWTRNLGLTGVNGTELDVKDMWVVREVGEGVNPTLAVIATRTRDGQSKTVGFHIDAFTGIVADGAGKSVKDLGKELFDGKAGTVFVTPFTNCGTENRVLAVVDEVEKVHLFPSCKKVAQDLEAISGDLFFTTTETSFSGTTFSGHVLSSLNSTIFKSSSVWSMSFTDGEVLTSTTPVINGAIASFGRAIGDKSTLYKYLNPHLVVLTVINAEKYEGKVIVVDTTTGRPVYDVVVRDLVCGKGIQVAMNENWLVYSYLDKHGWRLGSVELYEDRRDAKANTPGVSSFTADHGAVDGWAAQTFIAPGEIKALAMTTSKFGVTAKDLIYINDRDQVSTIPRRLLDPRRPVGKPTSGDKEEMLIPYDPSIVAGPKSIISHKYNILGAKHLTSSPALVESTSLLLVHGLDLFFSRGVNPSGTFDILTDGFNKAQLLLTLMVLSVGIAVARPAVRRKNLKAKWF